MKRSPQLDDALRYVITTPPPFVVVPKSRLARLFILIRGLLT